MKMDGRVVEDLGDMTYKETVLRLVRLIPRRALTQVECPADVTCCRAADYSRKSSNYLCLQVTVLLFKLQA